MQYTVIYCIYNLQYIVRKTTSKRKFTLRVLIYLSLLNYISDSEFEFRFERFENSAISNFLITDSFQFSLCFSQTASNTGIFGISAFNSARENATSSQLTARQLPPTLDGFQIQLEYFQRALEGISKIRHSSCLG